ncbi:MAG: hypothetical protein Q8S84_00005 [bacterium]|nr:hypothetical protein [bacterium]MDP3379983.1 hypothetical protein [bacterium]
MSHINVNIQSGNLFTKSQLANFNALFIFIKLDSCSSIFGKKFNKLS